MQIKSASSGAVSELKALMEGVNDPKKVREALDDLAQAQLDAGKAQQDAVLKLSALEKEREAIAVEKEALDSLAVVVAEKEKLVKQKESSFGDREANLAALERTREKEQVEFESYREEQFQLILSKQKEANKLFDDAAKAVESANKVKEEFEGKLAKLKALTQ